MLFVGGRVLRLTSVMMEGVGQGGTACDLPHFCCGLLPGSWKLLVVARAVRLLRILDDLITVSWLGAGVNVALINRYFTSKEGLFQRLDDLPSPTCADNLRRVPRRGGVAKIARRLTTPAPEPEPALLDGMLLLLLHLRRRTRRLRAPRPRCWPSANAIAVAAGSPGRLARTPCCAPGWSWRPRSASRWVRASVGVQPLATATEEEIRGPLTDLVRSCSRLALCRPRVRRRWTARAVRGGLPSVRAHEVLTPMGGSSSCVRGDALARSLTSSGPTATPTASRSISGSDLPTSGRTGGAAVRARPVACL